MTPGALRIAIVGAGPAGLYAAGHLLEGREHAVEIDLIDRLPTPWGLVRTGVAPDHQGKKRIADRLFDFHLRDARVQFIGNVTVGKDVQVAELGQWYDAVIYAQGADNHNTIGIPGEDLDGVWGAREFVQFYNAHPDQSHLRFGLSHPRAVIVGNGNVALDIARILTADVTSLEKTDISEHALKALRASQVREVVIMGRRDLDVAAFNNPELEELEHAAGVDVSVNGAIEPPSQPGDPLTAWRAQRRYDILSALQSRPRTPGAKRIVFHFLATPVALVGNGRVERLDYVDNRVARKGGAVSYERGAEIKSFDTGLVLAACGYRGTAMDGLPFDAVGGVIPNRAGRVLDARGEMPGTYVTGWIKRGCRGIIGSNRRCARETVSSLFADHAAGSLRAGALSREGVLSVLASRKPQIVLFEHWRAIDRAEQMAGRRSGRPRVKLERFETLLEAAFAPQAQSVAGAKLTKSGVP
jgi:ferredoxin/flavodoxin---NADP+ reductase